MMISSFWNIRKNNIYWPLSISSIPSIGVNLSLIPSFPSFLRDDPLKPNFHCSLHTYLQNSTKAFSNSCGSLVCSAEWWDSTHICNHRGRCIFQVTFVRCLRLQRFLIELNLPETPYALPFSYLLISSRANWSRLLEIPGLTLVQENHHHSSPTQLQATKPAFPIPQIA